MSINNLIDSVARCAICQTLRSEGCRCWVTLQCPQCQRTQSDERVQEDGDEDVILILCPDCLPPEDATPDA